MHDFMLESQLCFVIPQQLLTIWILREKELLQEISGMGELGGEWRMKQMDLLDIHLKLLRDYSQAKQTIQTYNGRGGTFFKPSTKKSDEFLEFVPVNLHLQRMWAHNDTLKKSGYLDVVTVGAFTKHKGKTKTGGLIKLLHQLKDTPTRSEPVQHKVQAANDVVQSIKQLRKEIVEIMSQLLLLAKTKSTKNMIPLCNEMISKSRALLNIWEPSLVEDAFRFIEKHRIVDEPDNVTIPLSPFKKITQQLSALDLKSPEELEDFATPSQQKSFGKGIVKLKSPSTTDIYSSTASKCRKHHFTASVENMSISLPPILRDDQNENGSFVDQTFNETHFDVNGKVSSSTPVESTEPDVDYQEDEPYMPNEHLQSMYDENGYLVEKTSIALDHNGAFLDTKVLLSSDFYRPSEEPEPLDLTQLSS